MSNVSELWRKILHFFTKMNGAEGESISVKNQKLNDNVQPIAEILKSPPPFKSTCSFGKDFSFDSEFQFDESGSSADEQKRDDAGFFCNDESLSDLQENDKSAEKNADKFSEMLNTEEFLKMSTELLLFFQTRLSELDETSQSETSWIIQAVDLLDEIRMMECNYAAEDMAAAGLIRNKLQNKLTELHVSIINKDCWDAEEQRAISIKQDPDVSVEQIERKGASGIVVDGKLIRKQEVFLIIPEKQVGGV